MANRPRLKDRLFALLTTTACALLFAIFRFTSFGKAIRACADNLLAVGRPFDVVIANAVGWAPARDVRENR